MSPHPYVGVFDDDPTQPQSPVKTVYSGVFDETPDEKNQSFFNYVGNQVKHFFAHDDFFDPAVQQRMLQGYGRTAKDLYHMFDKVLSYTPDISGVAHFSKDFAGTNLNPIEAVEGLPMGIVKPIGDLLEMSSGLSLGQDEPQQLTPEEIAERAKSAIALGATTFIAPGVSGLLGKSLLRNAAAGAITGASYGFIAGANDEDQMKQMLANGIIAAPLGVVIGALHGPKKTYTPTEVAQARELTSLDNSVGETFKTAQNIGDANDLADAMLDGKLGLQKGDVHIIPGVDPAKVARQDYKIPDGYRTALHVDKDGVGKLLVYDTDAGKLTFEQFNQQRPPVPGLQYHGSPEGDITNIDPYYHTKLWREGIGFFSTESRDAARMYAEGRTAIGGRVTQAKLGGKINYVESTPKSVLDFDAPVNQSLWNKIADDLDVNHIEEAKTNGEAYRELIHLYNTDNMTGEGIYAVEESLAAKGFDATQHMEGKAGVQPHKVTIHKAEGSARIVPVAKAYAKYLQSFEKGAPTINERFFEKNGVTDGQTVSYLGKEDWQVDGQSPKGLIRLKNKIDGNVVEAHPNDIQSPSNISFENALQPVVESYYKEFRAITDKPNDQASPTGQKYDPIGFDDTPPDNILEKNPDVDGFKLLNTLDDFIDSKKLSSNLSKQLKWEFQNRLVKEAFSNLEPEDQAMINEGRKIYQQDTRTAQAKVQDHKTLLNYAKLHGFNISEGSSGRYIIRELKTNKILAGADNVNAAREWIAKGGKATGPKLDDNEHVDPNIASGGMSLPPEGPPKIPSDELYDFAGSPLQASKGNPGENFIRMADNVSWLTRYRNYFSELDRKYQTNILRDIYERPSETHNIRNNQAEPFAKELGQIKISNRMSPEQNRLLLKYAETMSPQEVIKGYLSREMNPIEVALARQIHNANVDLDAVFKYRRNLESLDNTYTAEVRKDPAKELEYQQQKQILTKENLIDNNHQKVIDILDNIASMDRDKIHGGAVVRLARAMDDGTGRPELSKAEFAKKHNLDTRFYSAAAQRAALLQKLARAFGLADDEQLGNYNPHAALYFDGDVEKAVNFFSRSQRAKDFFGKLARTGEISALEDDPYKADLRYIKSGFDVKSGFTDALAGARSKIEDNLKQISDANVAGRARIVIASFLRELQGIPAQSDLAAKEVTNKLITKKYKILDKAVNSSWSRAIASTINAGALGARPMLGLGHLSISTIISDANRGTGYTARMLANGAKALHNYEFGDGKIIEDLRNKGVYRGLSPFSIIDPDIDPASMSGKFSNAIDKTQDALFKATLLPTVYDGLVAGHYTTTYGDVVENLTKLQRGDITAKQASKALYLGRFDEPVARRFVEIARTNIEDAAHYLAKNAVEDLVGTYGQGNNPHLWGTNTGRILGQFGTYSMWIRGTMQRMLSRGSWQERSTSLAKLTASWWIAHELSKESGIDLSRLSPVHAVVAGLGPLAGVGINALNAIHGSGYIQKQAQHNLLLTFGINHHSNGDITLRPSMFIPGSYAVDGIIQAADQLNQGNDAAAALQALGFRKYQAAKALGRGIP